MRSRLAVVRTGRVREVSSVIAVLVFAALLGPRPASAQQLSDTQVAASVRSCSYDTCALRVESSFWRGIRVVSGVRADSIAFGGLGGGLIRAVRGVPMAEREAIAGRRNTVTGSLWIIPSVLIGSALIIVGNDRGGFDDRRVAAGLGISTIGSFIGGHYVRRAENHYARAVWHYNRELAR
jgi:hypothetical protein